MDPELADGGMPNLPHNALEINERADRGEFVADLSLDPFAGSYYGTKPIWTVEDISANLNRTGYDWYTDNEGALDDNTLNFAFFNVRSDFNTTGYINDSFTVAFSEYFGFVAFTAGQRVAARNAIETWDDLISIDIVESNDITNSELRFGSTTRANAGSQAYAYLPFGSIYNNSEGFEDWSNIDDLGGDVWLNANIASNRSPLGNSYYAMTTLIHELGHALGLSHPGDYNASDDNDGDGQPDPITYGNDAYFAQDSVQYSIMSYFDAYETGAQHIDWSLLNFAYAATPMVHDIAAIQAIYGADMNTRTGDTVYGFNSNADRDAYHFDINTRPIVAVYDAGGNDTLDFSGWNTPSVIDLNGGAFSSGGGTERFLTLEEVNANRAAAGLAARSQATYDLYFQLFAGPQGLTNGLFRDNISIAYGTVIENAIGGGGNDLIIANSAANRLTGNGGIDTVSYETATTGVTVSLLTGTGSGGAAGDRLFTIENLIGSDFDDTLTGDNNANTLEGGAGNDSLSGRGGDDRIDGGDGSDTADYADGAQGVTVNLATGTATGAQGSDTLISIENIRGSRGDDTLTGDDGANRIKGETGNDRIDGGLGDDELYGDGGDDTIISDLGNDLIGGGAGIDTLDFYVKATSGVTVNLMSSHAQNTGMGMDRISGIENLRGSRFDDILTGDNNANSIKGEMGNDIISGGGGADTLFGDGGDDIIDGGAGKDIIGGGVGTDRFVFTTLDGDEIKDWVAGEYIDAIGTGAVDFSIAHVGGKSLVTFDVDGDGAYDDGSILVYTTSASLGDYILIGEPILG